MAMNLVSVKPNIYELFGPGYPSENTANLYIGLTFSSPVTRIVDTAVTLNYNDTTKTPPRVINGSNSAYPFWWNGDLSNTPTWEHDPFNPSEGHTYSLVNCLRGKLTSPINTVYLYNEISFDFTPGMTNTIKVPQSSLKLSFQMAQYYVENGHLIIPANTFFNSNNEGNSEIKLYWYWRPDCSCPYPQPATFARTGDVELIEINSSGFTGNSGGTGSTGWTGATPITETDYNLLPDTLEVVNWSFDSTSGNIPVQNSDGTFNLKDFLDYTGSLAYPYKRICLEFNKDIQIVPVLYTATANSGNTVNGVLSFPDCHGHGVPDITDEDIKLLDLGFIVTYYQRDPISTLPYPHYNDGWEWYMYRNNFKVDGNKLYLVSRLSTSDDRGYLNICKEILAVMNLITIQGVDGSRLKKPTQPIPSYLPVNNFLQYPGIYWISLKIAQLDKTELTSTDFGAVTNSTFLQSTGFASFTEDYFEVTVSRSAYIKIINDEYDPIPEISCLYIDPSSNKKRYTIKCWKNKPLLSDKSEVSEWTNKNNVQLDTTFYFPTTGYDSSDVEISNIFSQPGKYIITLDRLFYISPTEKHDNDYYANDRFATTHISFTIGDSQLTGPTGTTGSTGSSSNIEVAVEFNVKDSSNITVNSNSITIDLQETPLEPGNTYQLSLDPGTLIDSNGLPYDVTELNKFKFTVANKE